MSRRHLPGLLAYLLLVLAAPHALADPAKSPTESPIDYYDTCPVTVKVGRGFGPAFVLLEDTLEFYLKPNQAQMSVRFRGADSLYKASVEGTMVKLFGCDVRGADCRVLDEGGTKGSDLLLADEWNRVQVKYIDGEVSVDINMRSEVMGKHMMPIPKDPRKSKGGRSDGGFVSFIVPPTSPSYYATLNVSCNANRQPPYIDTELPDLPALPTTTPVHTPTSPMDSQPFPNCPVYKIETDHPTPANGEPVQETFTFAVYPSHPVIRMNVFSDQLYIKVLVNGPRAELYKCNMAGRICSLESSTASAHNVLDPGRWNEATIYLKDGKLFIRVNNIDVFSSSLESGGHKGLRVVVMEPLGTSTEDSGYFTALVNVQCVGTDQRIIHFSTAPTPTRGDLPTKDSIVASPSTEPAPKTDSSGISRNVGIVVGVLVGLLLIITIAIVISTYKKRRSATLNEHSPLQDQHQQHK